MSNPAIDTWMGEDEDLDLSAIDIGKWFEGSMPKAVLGWNGLKIWDTDVDPVALLSAYLQKVSDESCGQCTPCRLGTARMATLSKKLADGRGTREELNQIRHLAVQISRTGRCDIGRTLAKPVMDLTDACRKAFDEALKTGVKASSGTYAATVTAPCISACPSSVDIPAYLENIRMNRWSEAMDAVRNDCAMPGTIGRVCVRPCETRCRRGALDEPLAIKSLKRFLGDREMEGKLSSTLPDVPPPLRKGGSHRCRSGRPGLRLLSWPQRL